MRELTDTISGDYHRPDGQQEQMRALRLNLTEKRFSALASPSAMGTGARAPLDFQLFNFSGHFRAAQTLTFDSMWLPIPVKITLLVSCPRGLAPNPGAPLLFCEQYSQKTTRTDQLCKSRAILVIYLCI